MTPGRWGVLLLATGCLLAACSGDEQPQAETPRPTATTSGSASTAESTTNEASGWRLEVLSPTDDAQVTQPFTICYGLTGSSRSAEVELMVSLENPPGEGPDAGPRKFAAAVGRGSILVPVDKLSTGMHDVRITMSVDGEPQGDVVLDNLRIAGDRAPANPSGCE